MLVEIVAADDDRVFETCRIQNLAGFDAEIGEIARIKPDAGQLMPSPPQPFAGLDRPTSGEVRIDEHRATRLVAADEVRQTPSGTDLLEQHEVGDTVQVTIVRDGQQHQVPVKLAPLR